MITWSKFFFEFLLVDPCKSVSTKRGNVFKREHAMISVDRRRNAIEETFFAICDILFNFKNVKNTHGGVKEFLVKLQNDATSPVPTYNYQNSTSMKLFDYYIHHSIFDLRCLSSNYFLPGNVWLRSVLGYQRCIQLVFNYYFEGLYLRYLQ